MSSETQVATIDLQKFCARGESFTRYDVERTWIRDGWEYATDFRLCIRIPATGKLDTPAEDGEFPNAPDLFKFDPATCVLEWPAEPFFRAVADCPQCGGEGKIACEDCGEIVAECLYPGCRGHGAFEQDIYRFVGKHRIGVRYDRLINSLPGVRWSDKSRDGELPLFFVFDGGQGMVMGMRRSEKEGDVRPTP